MFSVTTVVPPTGGGGGGIGEDALTTMVVPGGGRLMSSSGLGRGGLGKVESGKGSISIPKQISAKVLNFGPSVSR